MKQIRLGSIQGYTWSDEAVNKYLAEGKSPAVQEITGKDPVERNLKKLQQGKTDAYLETKDLARYYAKIANLPFDQLFKSGGEIPATPHYVCFSAKNPKSKTYAKQLSDGMDKLRSSGNLATILAKYGLTDWR